MKIEDMSQFLEEELQIAGNSCGVDVEVKKNE